jgi:hypothetical protein
MAAVLIPSAVQAGATTVTTPVKPTAEQLGRFNACTFLLQLTAAATLAGDTLDVFLQHSPDGTLWDDFLHFTQMLGNGGTKNFLAYWNALAVPANALRAPGDGVLAAGVRQGPAFNNWRCKAVSVGTGSFTFAIFFRPAFATRTG